ncbi:MAG: hypothetical protein V5A13_02845 [Haloarculaceae archaeon]
MPVDRSQFRALCRGRPRRDLVAFVAAIEEARGRSVDRLGDGRLRVHAPAGSREVVVRQPGEYGASGLDGADRAVVLGALDTDDPRVRDLDDLHRELCYAVDRPEARQLVATHFDRDPRTLPGPTPHHNRPESGRWLPTPDWPGPGVPWAAALAALGVCVLVVGVAAAVGATGVLGSPAANTSADPVEPVEVDGSRLTPAADGGVGQQSVDDYPSGVSPDGAVDPRIVSRVHRVTLDDRSYTARLRYREYRNGELAGRYTEVLRVQDESHYASRVTSTGVLEGAPMRIATADSYADGSTEYVRKDGDRWSLTVRDGDPFLPRVRSYLAWKFSVEETTVERVPVGVRVRFAGEAYGTSTPVTGYAVVTEEGLVRSLRRSYELESGTRVVVTLNTTNVGETTVEKPAWVS